MNRISVLDDIGRQRERVGEIDNPGDLAAIEATRLLDAENVPAEQVSPIEHCLRAHSIRASSPTPETIEAQLLFDADKLDATGAVGLVRLACIIGERSGRAGEQYAIIDESATLPGGAPEHPDIELIREWARERLDALYTDPARELGAARWDVMETFFEQFTQESSTDTGV